MTFHGTANVGMLTHLLEGGVELFHKHDRSIVRGVINYITRTVLKPGKHFTPSIGIPKGGSTPCNLHNLLTYLNNPQLGEQKDARKHLKSKICLTIIEISINKAIEKGKRYYAQKGTTALATYLKRWRYWAQGGLKHTESSAFKEHLQLVCDYIKHKIKAQVILHLWQEIRLALCKWPVGYMEISKLGWQMPT